MDIAAYLIPVCLLIPYLGLLAAWVGSKVDRVHRGLARLERKTDLILDHLGIDPGPDLDRIRALLRDGKMVHAVRLYRDQTGASLTRAARVVRRIAAARPDDESRGPPAQVTSSCCSSAASRCTPPS